jgi:hypothetical protein
MFLTGVRIHPITPSKGIRHKIKGKQGNPIKQIQGVYEETKLIHN